MLLPLVEESEWRNDYEIFKAIPKLWISPNWLDVTDSLQPASVTIRFIFSALVSQTVTFQIVFSYN